MTLPKAKAKSQQVAGRPTSKVEASPGAFTVTHSRRKKPAVRLGDRQKAEEFVQDTLSSLIADYDEMLRQQTAVINGLLAAIEKAASEHGEVNATLLRMLEAQQQRKRQTLKDKQHLADNLVHRFELLTELNRPEDQDPKFTPVHLTISNTPPAGAFVQPSYQLSDDDLQPTAPA